MGAFRRFLHRLQETDEERLADEVREWSEGIPDTVRIADAPTRERVTLAGEVGRISLVPGESADSFEAVITDGTDSITAVWTGRRAIPGLTLGTRVIVKGVLSASPTGRRMVNPAFEFAPAAPEPA